MWCSWREILDDRVINRGQRPSKQTPRTRHRQARLRIPPDIWRFFYDTCYDREGTFREKTFLNSGAPFNPKIVGNRSFVCMILVVYLGHGVFHLVAVLFLSKSVFWVKKDMT